MTSRKHVDDEQSAEGNDAAVLEALDWDPFVGSGPQVGVGNTPLAVQPATPTRTREVEEVPQPRRRRQKFTWNSDTGAIAPKAEPRPSIKMTPQPEQTYFQEGAYGD